MAVLVPAALAAEVPPLPLLLLVGDSTVAPQTGNDEALCERLHPAAACLNLGRDGRSSPGYRAEGLWDRVLARLAARAPCTHAWVLVQFGHNDQRVRPGRSTDQVNTYPAHLTRHVAELRAAAAAGAGDTTGAAPVPTGGAGDVALHLADNLVFIRDGDAAPLQGRYTASQAQVLPAPSPGLPARLRALPAADLQAQPLPRVGARPWDRDLIDARLLRELSEGRLRLIDSESQVGGLPRPAAPTRRTFDPAARDLRDLSPRAGWHNLFPPGTAPR
jgi:hypothetical protein